MSSHLRLVAATAPRLSPTAADFESADRPRRRFVARAFSWGKGAVRVLERLGGAFEARPTERGVELHAAALPGARFELGVERKHLDLSLELGGAALDAFAQAIDRDGTMRWLAALPEQFVACKGTVELCASTIDRHALRSMIESARSERVAVRIGWRIPRSVVLSHARVLDEQLLDALRALVLVEGAIAGRAPSASALSPHRMTASLSTRRARLATTGMARLRLRGALGRPRLEAAHTPSIDRGTRVRVLAGPFEGKIGVVQALDARAARVFFGLLATRVELADLAPAHAPGHGRAPSRRPRPAIATSHRRRP